MRSHAAWWSLAVLLAALGSPAGLLAANRGPGIALLLTLPLLAELAPSTLILADNSAGARYMLDVYPAYWVSVWFGAAFLLGPPRNSPHTANAPHQPE